MRTKRVKKKTHLTTIGMQGCFETFARKLLIGIIKKRRDSIIYKARHEERKGKETIIPLFIEHKGTLK